MDAPTTSVRVTIGTGRQARATGLTEAEFRTAFENNARTIFRLAYSRVGKEAAEDVLSDTFIEAWRVRDRFDPSRASLEQWLYGIARVRIASHRRAEARWLRMCATSALQSDSWLVEDVAEAADDRASASMQSKPIARRLRRLPPHYREPFLMHVIAGFSYEEIAAVFDLPVGTVRSRIHRARTRLAGRSS